MALEIMLSAVIYEAPANIPHAKQVAIFRQAAEKAIAKFEQSGELPLNAGIDFEFQTEDGTRIDVWLTRPLAEA